MSEFARILFLNFGLPVPESDQGVAIGELSEDMQRRTTFLDINTDRFISENELWFHIYDNREQFEENGLFSSLRQAGYEDPLEPIPEIETILLNNIRRFHEGFNELDFFNQAQMIFLSVAGNQDGSLIMLGREQEQRGRVESTGRENGYNIAQGGLGIRQDNLLDESRHGIWHFLSREILNRRPEDRYAMCLELAILTYLAFDRVGIDAAIFTGFICQENGCMAHAYLISQFGEARVAFDPAQRAEIFLSYPRETSTLAEVASWHHSNEAIMMFNNNQPLENVRQRFELALSIYPDNIPALMELGRTYLVEGSNTENGDRRRELYLVALEYYRRAFHVDNTLPLSLNRMGEMYYLLNNMEDAQFYYEQALRYTPYNIRTLLGIAGVAESRGNYTEAMRYYQQVGSNFYENEYITPTRLVAEIERLTFYSKTKGNNTKNHVPKYNNYPAACSCRAVGSQYSTGNFWSQILGIF